MDECILTEINESLRGFGNVTVLFPGEPDIDEDWFVERQGLDTRRVGDDEIQQESNADAILDEPLDRLDLIGFQHDIRGDAGGFEFLLQTMAQVCPYSSD